MRRRDEEKRGLGERKARAGVRLKIRDRRC
jgi:hypothetical protein